MKKVLSMTLVVVMQVMFVFGGLSITPNGISNVNASAEVSNPRITADDTVWDCVYFGSYPQSSDGQGGFVTEPIKWRVLSVENGEVLLLADKGLDCKKYNEEFEEITWETCSLRNWLNSSFYNTAFSSGEKSDIIMSEVDNKEDEEGVISGNNTFDNVFMPSKNDIYNSKYGLFDRAFSKVSDYAKSNGAYESQGEHEGKWVGNGNYWLRKPGGTSLFADLMIYRGVILEAPPQIGESIVRPMIKVNSSSLLMNSAGTISSKDDIIELQTTSEEATENTTTQNETITEKTTEEATTDIQNTTSYNEITTAESDNNKTITAISYGDISNKVKTPKIKKAVKKKSSKKIRVRLTKNKSVKGYKVAVYKTKKQAKKNKKALLVRYKRKAKFAIKSKRFKHRKKLFIKVKAYGIINHKKVYSKWSKVKRVKTK